MQQQVDCIMKYLNWAPYKEKFYSCKIKNQTMEENAELEFIEFHERGKSNRDVTALIFVNCTITKIPQGLTKVFPNLKILDIYKSKLKHVERVDLKDLCQLEALSFNYNEIKSLPDDLLSDMKNLEIIDLFSNNIEIIGPNFLDDLNKIRLADFSSNPCIDMLFDSINNSGKATLDDIKQAIRQRYLNQNGIGSDLKLAIENEKLKDCTVKVEGEELKAHKLLLAARSSTILEMIESNINATNLNLDDISAETFRVILNFIYTDELPKFKFVNIFIAADKLKIGQLKYLCAEKLIEEMNADNAFEMLKLANKYDHERLRRKSFEEIKKMLGGKIDGELAKKPDLLQEAFKYKKEIDKKAATMNCILMRKN